MSSTGKVKSYLPTHQSGANRSAFGKRLMPLLDVMFLLLIFFLVLPQGTETEEIKTLNRLEKKFAEDKRELDFMKWRFGAVPPPDVTLQRTVEVVVKKHRFHFQDRFYTLPQIEERLLEGIYRKRFDGVVIKAREGKYLPVMDLISFLQKKHIQYLLTE